MPARRQIVDRLPAISQENRIINGVLDGWTGNTGVVTLATGTTSTTLKSQIFRPSTTLILVPLSQAAAAIAWWQTAAGLREVVLGHDSPGTDLEFAWTAMG